MASVASRSRASRRPSSPGAAGRSDDAAMPRPPRASRLAERRERRRGGRGPRRGRWRPAARFLEARPRSVARGPAPTDRGGLPARSWSRTAIDRLTDLALPRRRGVRAGLGRVPRPRPSTRRARPAPRAAPKGVDRTIVDAVLAERRGTGDGATPTSAVTVPTGPRPTSGRAAARAQARAPRREPDPRRRRQRPMRCSPATGSTRMVAPGRRAGIADAGEVARQD